MYSILLPILFNRLFSSDILLEHIDAFVEFQKTHEKSYDTAEEEVRRMHIFMENLEYILKENEKELPYRLEINEFADLTLDEFKQRYVGGFDSSILPKKKKLLGSPLDKFVRSDHSSHYLGMHHFGGRESDLPESKDWSHLGAVTGVKNQGHCGSCWAFSTTGSIEGNYEILTGKLLNLSEQQLVDCSGKYGNLGCNGGIMDFGFEYVADHGICSEDDYEYDGVAHSNCSKCNPVIPPKGDAIQFPKESPIHVSGYKDVAPKDKLSMMDAVSRGPVSVAIEADQLAFQFYKDGVLTANCGSKLNHGVLLVGYGTLDGTPYWKIKNSWGPGWGKDGYILIQRGKPGAGECGILLQGSYPVLEKDSFSSEEM